MSIDKMLQWFKGLPDRVDLLLMFSNFVWIDWVTLTFVIIGFFYGIRRGMMRMMAELVEMVIVIFMTMQLYPKVAYYLTNYIEKLSPKVATVLAFIITLSLIWVLVTIIDSYLKKLLKTELLWPFRVLGGAFFGIIGAFLILGIFTEGIQLIPNWRLKKVMEPGFSITGSKISRIVPFINETLTNPISVKNVMAPTDS